MNKVYEIVTERIIQLLEQGTVPWHQPWKNIGQPVNYITRKPYQGINVFLLAVMKRTTPYWLTFKQCQTCGGRIKSGEKASIIVFWNWIEKTKRERKEGAKDEIKDAINDDGAGSPQLDSAAREQLPAKESVPFLKYYYVFNLDQCEGIEPPAEEPRPVSDRIASCAAIIDKMLNRPSIAFDGNEASYQPLKDVITIPLPSQFNRLEEYYSTLFHELTHSTGHPSRLNRKTLTDLCPFGITNHSKEELIAEMGASFLCAHAGIENRTIDNSAAYIQNWLRKLDNDRKLLVLAASQAQRAANYVLSGADKKEERQEDYASNDVINNEENVAETEAMTIKEI